MSIDVRETIVIESPRRSVAAYAMDPGNDTRWIGGIEEVAWITEPPLRVGSRVRRVARFLGRSIDYVLEVVAMEPESRVVMRSVKSPFPMVVTYTFADEGRATEAGVRVQGGAGLLFRLASPLMARQVGANLRGDLRRLKRLLEAAPAVRD
jgi:hypothetical protein